MTPEPEKPISYLEVGPDSPPTVRAAYRLCRLLQLRAPHRIIENELMITVAKVLRELGIQEEEVEEAKEWLWVAIASRAHSTHTLPGGQPGAPTDTRPPETA